MKRCTAALILLVVLCAAQPAWAGHFAGEGHQVILNDEIVMRLEKIENWTIVTPETVEEHMGVLTRNGASQEEVRRRFSQDHILAEAYHDGLPNGCVRMQMFEDDRSRAVWNLKELSKKQRAELKNELRDTLFQGYLRLFNISDNFTHISKNWTLWGSVIAYPPSAYESGLFTLRYWNGRAYLLSYVQPTPASSKKLLNGTHTFARAVTWTDLMGDVPAFVGKEQRPAADLLPGDTLRLNAHSGRYRWQGLSEKGARVTVETGGEISQAQVDGEGRFTAALALAPGINEIVMTAEKEGCAASHLRRTLRADDAMAALELTEYPHGIVDRKAMKVEGKASPGASVTLRVDDQAPKTLSVDQDGAFSHIVEAADWEEHTLEITASETGLAPCAARFTFRPVYEDAAKGIKVFSKTLDKAIGGKALSADPGGYEGKRIKLEVYTTEAQRQEGRLILNGNINKDKSRPVILVCPDYLDDQIQDKMILTVYGTVISPSQTQVPVPRVDVEYLQYRKTVYRKHTWY